MVFAFLDVIGFSRQRRFVHFQVVALDENSVGRQQIAILDLTKGKKAMKRHEYTLGVVEKIDFFLIKFFIWKSFLPTKRMILVFIPSF